MQRNILMELLFPHGLGGYKHGCYCGVCTEANERVEGRIEARRKMLKENPEGFLWHGDGGGYQYGYRCEVCVESFERLERERERRKRNGR